MPADVTIKQGDSFTIRISHIDNELSIRLNGATVYHRGLHGDPAIDDTVDLTHRLAVGCNNLSFELFNWPQATGNPWHVAYDVFHKLNNVSHVDDRSEGDQDPHGGLRWRDEIIIKVQR